MSGTNKPPIKYTDDAVLVSPEDWNDLIDIIDELKTKILTLDATVVSLQSQIDGHHP